MHSRIKFLLNYEIYMVIFFSFELLCKNHSMNSIYKKDQSQSGLIISECPDYFY